MGETLCLGYTVTVLHEENFDNGEREGEGASGWIFIFQDLTNLKGMEEHVRRMERLAFAGKIAAEIAHEIKNPLASMSGAVQMLQGQIDHGSLQSRLIGIVDREIDRINELVTDFLWLARGARKPERIEKVEACTIIQEVLTLLKTRDKITSDHQVRTDFGCASTLMMDPHHFRQILWNLLVNAVEAMPRGGEVFIRVRSLPIPGSDSEEVCIDVRDMGSGISEDFRDRVFDPFFTTKQNGTGLGLSIVYQLVENAGGRVDVTHHDGHGTTFSLFFPTSPDFPLAN
jgi:two-component system sensor histidine kinase PilS (NtrC family)